MSGTVSLYSLKEYFSQRRDRDVDPRGSRPPTHRAGIQQGRPRRRRRAHVTRSGRAPEVRPRSRSGGEGVKAVIESLRRAFSDFHLAIEDLVVDGDTVWLRMVGT